MNLKATHDDNKIIFLSEDHTIYGFTDYTEESWALIGGLNWYVSDKDLEEGKRTYIYTGSAPFSKRYRKLYEVVMCYWYGKNTVDKMRDRRFIIEHLDNNPHNCSVENLAFAHEELNKTKAFSYDKTRPELVAKVAMNIYKNFETHEFEINLAFNQLYTLTLDENNTNKTIPLNALFLQYPDDFEIVLHNANFIETSLKRELSLNIDGLNCYSYQYEAAKFLTAVPGKTLPSLVKHNGNWYLVLNENSRLLAIAPSWKRRNLI